MNQWSEAEQFYYLLLGERVAEYRRAAGFSQQVLAQLVGCSRAALSNWEHGRHAPNGYQVMRLCRALACDPDELLPALPDLAGLSDTPVERARTSTPAR